MTKIKKKRVYISGPMSGDPDYRRKFKAAENCLRCRGYRVINPANAVKLLPEAETTRGEYLRVDMVLVGMCGIIAMLPGWEHSRGAKRELRRANEIGLEVLYLDEHMELKG